MSEFSPNQADIEAQGQVSVEQMAYQQLSMSELVELLKPIGKHKRGLALEAMALKIMHLIGQSYLDTRMHELTGERAEVTVVCESTRPTYVRWQIFCTNATEITLDDVARQVGLSYLFGGSAILVVVNGEVSPEARRFADVINKDTSLRVNFLDGHDLAEIVKDQGLIIRILDREAKRAQKLKPVDRLEAESAAWEAATENDLLSFNKDHGLAEQVES